MTSMDLSKRLSEATLEECAAILRKEVDRVLKFAAWLFVGYFVITWVSRHLGW